MSLPLHDEALCRSILDRAVDLGIRLFDTADLYDKGLNESFVGRILRHLAEPQDDAEAEAVAHRGASPRNIDGMGGCAGLG